MSYSKQYSKFNWMIALGLAFAVSACGGTSYRDNVTTTPGGSTTPSTPSNPSTDPEEGTTDENFAPALSYTFDLSGENGPKSSWESPKISTDSILRVRIKAGPAQNITIPGYEAFSAPYNCAAFNMQILANGATEGQSVNTSALAVDGGNPNICAQTVKESQTFNFSGWLGGASYVKIKISKARYDFYCQLWSSGWVYGSASLYCPLRNAFKDHRLSGELEVEINGTKFQN